MPWPARRDGRRRRAAPRGTLTRERTHAERLASTDGWFAPDSVIRRLGNTPLTPMLGGGTAVLLQVAHPLVAAGVAEHSGYDHNLWRRLVGTLHAVYFLTFGDRAEAGDAVHRAFMGAGHPGRQPFVFTDPQLYAEYSFVFALVEALKGKVVGFAFVVELSALNGREALKGYDVFSIVRYTTEED